MTTKVLSMVAAHSQPEYPKVAEGQIRMNVEPTPMDQSGLTSPDRDDATRGRRRNRDSDDDEHGDAMDVEGGGGTGSSKKRRRSRKGLDKKFECPHEGCGKSYSRAEHLYRHQLNHNPKQIYYCDFPECHRSFVRQDLCARHKERHTARGSQLLRRDNLMQNINPIVTAALQQKAGTLGRPQDSPTVRGGDAGFSHAHFGGNQTQAHSSERVFVVQSPSSGVASSATAGSEASPPVDPHIHSPNDHGSAHGLKKSQSDDNYRMNDPSRSYEMSSPRVNNGTGFQRQSSFGSQTTGRAQLDNDGFARPALQTSTPSMQNLSLNSPYTPSQGASSQTFGRPSSSSNFTPQAPSSFQSQQNFPPMSTLPPPGYSTMSQASSGDNTGSGYGVGQQSSMTAMDTSTSNMHSVSEALVEGMTPTYSIPVFGGEGYSRSPFAMADDFAAWLFNDSHFGPSASPMGYPGTTPMTGVVGASAQLGLQAPYFNYDPLVSGYFTQPAPQSHPMAVKSILDTNMQQLALSDDKRREILDLIETRFNDASHALVKKKEDLFEGNKDDEHHVLSLQMMQTYIGSFWIHFHPQMPILHKPTFSANSCPDLLLLAIMALGASCLEKRHGYDVTQNCSELSNFLAWHLRWEVFMHADFRPPAKLWIFQTLLLLEIFEKMYSSRPLHERAHIHHATTLTLMRRGSSLIGRSATESPPSVKGEKLNGSMNGSINASGTNTPDDWWNQWITNEATRRAAFAAFVMDSVHATMFGHSAVMVAHEMRLPLPCDEALWSATSSAEVGRVEQSLHQNGIKPTTFLDGLKKTLNGHNVRTNSFGRTILMAGLLSVSWHMNQRDLQVSSLGVTQALGGRDKWRGSLTRAFDYWKRDFDDSLSKSTDSGTSGGYHQFGYRVDDDNVFESRTVLHHLAHMAMHIDIVDCQIFAGAHRLLGRSITPQDYNSAQRRMKETWAPTARARDATFYALRFLAQVLLPEDNGMINNPQVPPEFTYSARDDVLLNRPWVLYFATLIVWSYGYALDGPITPLYTLNTPEETVRDMQGFLKRVGGVRAPDDLAKIANRNACLGLLILMRDTFAKTRWELLHEASKLLTKCIEMLAPSTG